MNAYEKIRAALMLAQDAGRIHILPGLVVASENALAALAELERAAAEPLFILTTGAIDSDGEQDDWDIECDSSRQLDAFCAAHPGAKVNLYATPPPAPVAEMREPTPEECERIARESTVMMATSSTYEQIGRAMFRAVREVMGGEK